MQKSVAMERVEAHDIAVHRTKDVQFIDTLSSEFEPYITTDQNNTVVSARNWIDHPSFIALKVDLDGKPAGAVVFVGTEAHTLFRKQLRGRLGIIAARKVIQWIWDNTKLQVITTFAYTNRPDVLIFTKWLGFTATSIIDNAATINGRPVSRINLILERN